MWPFTPDLDVTISSRMSCDHFLPNGMRPLPPECYVPIPPRVSCDHFLPNVVRPLPPDVVRALGERWEVSKEGSGGALGALGIQGVWEDLSS